MSARLFQLTKIYRFDNPKKLEEAELPWEGWLDKVINHGLSDPGHRTTEQGKGDLSGYHPGAFKPGTRQTRAEDVRSLSALILDFDENPDKDLIAQCFAGWRYFAHTSINHLFKPDVAKWRIILPLSEDITPKNFLPVWRWAEQRCADFGIVVDKQCKNIDRKWVYPHKRTDGTYDEMWGQGEFLDPKKCKAEQQAKQQAAPVYGDAFIQKDIKELSAVTLERGDTLDIERWMHEAKVGGKMKCYCPLLPPEKRNSVGAVMVRTGRGVTLKCGAMHHAEHAGKPLFIRIEDPKTNGGERQKFDQSVWASLEKRIDKHGNVLGPKANKFNLLTILEHDAYLKEHLWFNAFTNQAIFNGIPLTDETAFEVLVWVERAYQTEFPVSLFDRALVTALAKRSINPLQEWANSLEWDGTDRLSRLAELTCGNTGTLENKMVSNWLVQAATRLLTPGAKADDVLILQGPQGYFKSTFFKYLATPEYFSDTFIDIESRQGVIQTHFAWIHELGELSTLRKHEVNAVKNFVARTADCYVPPYGKRAVNILRKCVFGGTVNEDEFLLDDTGNRRFMIVVCHKRVDIDYIEKNREQIWAQAVSMAKSGHQYWLNLEESKDLSIQQENFREKHPWEDAISLWLSKNQDCIKVFRLEKIFEEVVHIDLKNQNKGMQITVGKILKRRGCEKFLVRIPGIEVPISYYRMPTVSHDQAVAEAKRLHGINPDAELVGA